MCYCVFHATNVFCKTTQKKVSKLAEFVILVFVKLFMAGLKKLSGKGEEGHWTVNYYFTEGFKPSCSPVHWFKTLVILINA